MKTIFQQLINENTTDPTDYLRQEVEEAKNFTPLTNFQKAEKLLLAVKTFYIQLSQQVKQVEQDGKPLTIEPKYLEMLEGALAILKKNGTTTLSYGEHAAQARLEFITEQIVAASPELIVEIAKLGGITDPEELKDIESLRTKILSAVKTDSYFATKVNILLKRTQPSIGE